MTRANILIVDDDDRLRTMYATYLIRHGYDVVEAQDGFDALLRLRQVPVDLMIADVNMPKINGLALIRRVRQHPCTLHLPIILFSGVVDIDDMQRAIEAGANACLDKAGDLKEFGATISRLLSEQELGRDIETMERSAASCPG